MPAIETRDLTHSYRKNFWEKRRPALDGLTLTVEEGEIFGFLGANGAGKTTTIKILVGLAKPDKGESFLFGESTDKVSTRRLVGFMPENPYFYEYLTAKESLNFYGGLCGLSGKECRSRGDELLDFVGLRDAGNKRLGEFSKGMRQRLGIAQAIIHRPRLAILDEPMSGLDPAGRRQVREAMRNLADSGTTVFFSTHILSDVEMICHRIALLDHGKLVAKGDIADLLKPQADQNVEVGAENLGKDLTDSLAAAAKRVITTGKEKVFVYAGQKAAQDAVDKIMTGGGELTLFRPIKDTLEDYFLRRADGEGK